MAADRAGSSFQFQQGVLSCCSSDCGGDTVQINQERKESKVERIERRHSRVERRERTKGVDGVNREQ